jgi:hypothetical protein
MKYFIIMGLGLIINSIFRFAKKTGMSIPDKVNF